MAHTPTPWRTAVAAIHSGHYVTSTAGPVVDAGAVGRDDAAHIVRCVNAHDELVAALNQITVLSEYGTTGPDTTPRCKSDAMTSAKATSLRGSISEIARYALAKVAP